MRRSNFRPTRDIVRTLPLFAELEDSALEQIAGAARALEVKRGAAIIERGSRLDGFYGVYEGQLKIYLLSCNGAERIVRLMNPGDCFGEAIMFMGIPSPVFVQALSDTQLCYFPKDSVYTALAGQPDFTFAMLQGLSRMLAELIQDLEACCMQNAQQRIAHYLLCNYEATRDGRAAVQLPASKAIVASTLNISAETFSRELHQLARDGMIAVQRRTIFLTDMDGLRTLAERGRAETLAS